MVRGSGSRRDASSTKQGRGQKVRSATQSNVLRVSIDKNARHGSVGAMKYLRKSCYHRIECSAANFLVAFMWRRPLNSAVLTAPTHRGSVRVFDGTITQVVAWTINKLRAKIIQRELYNVRDPPWKGDQRIEKRIL